MTNYASTPGPWHVSDNGGHIADRDDKFIRWINDGERTADVRVQAAAPELVEALERLLSSDAQDPRDAQFARGVLAKVRGEL